MVLKLRHHLSVMAWNMFRFSLVLQSTNVTIANVNGLVLFWETVVFVDSCSLCAAVSACTTRSRLFARTFTKRSGNGSDSHDIQKDLWHWAKTNVSYSGREFQYSSSASLLVTMARYFTRSCPCRITNWKMTWEDGIFLILMGISC